MTNLKIAVVRPFFTLTKGGAERYAVELVRALVSEGQVVHVFAYQWDEPREKGVNYHHVGMVRKPSWLRVLTFHWNLRRCLVSREYDIIFGMTPFAPQMVSWLGDGLYAVWTRVAWPLKLLRSFMCLKRAVMLANLWLERRVMRGGATHFIANSSLVKRQAMAYYHVPEERISVVYPGIDLNRFHVEARQQWRRIVRQELGISNDEMVLLFVSNNFKRKGLDFLLRALAIISSEGPRLRLLVIGKGKSLAFGWLAKRLGIGNRVIYIRSTDAIERYYAAADIFVLPTRYDPFAVVCLEAMACGLPVITTRMNGAADLITDGREGFLLHQTNVETELTVRIRALLEPERRAAMGALAAERAKPFSADEHVHGIVSTLCRVTANRQTEQQPKIVRAGPDLMVNQAFLPLLERHHLASYSDLIQAREGKPFEYNRTKRLFVFKLQDRELPISLYLKCHRFRLTLLDRCRQLFRRKVITDGMREWQNILAFHAWDLPTITPVAAGERLLAAGIKESLVMTLGLDDHVPLDEYVGKRFRPPLNEIQLKEKHALIKAVAGLTRDMHWSGFNHRDNYLCHLFIKRCDNRHADLRLIDLQRAGYHMRPRARWHIKDLAQLHFSSLPLPLTDWDRLRFYTIYSAKQERTIRRARLRWVLRKSRAIARHDARHRNEV